MDSAVTREPFSTSGGRDPGGQAIVSDPPEFMAGPSTGTRILSDRYTMHGLGAFEDESTKCPSPMEDETVREQRQGMNFCIFAIFLCLLSLVASPDAKYAPSSTISSRNCSQDLTERFHSSPTSLLKDSNGCDLYYEGQPFPFACDFGGTVTPDHSNVP